jgi:hypothetical protein
MKYTLDIETKEIFYEKGFPKGHIKALEKIYLSKGYTIKPVDNIIADGRDEKDEESNEIAIDISELMGTPGGVGKAFDVTRWIDIVSKTGYVITDSSKRSTHSKKKQ